MNSYLSGSCERAIQNIGHRYSAAEETAWVRLTLSGRDLPSQRLNPSPLACLSRYSLLPGKVMRTLGKRIGSEYKDMFALMVDDYRANGIVLLFRFILYSYHPSIPFNIKAGYGRILEMSN